VNHRHELESNFALPPYSSLSTRK